MSACCRTVSLKSLSVVMEEKCYCARKIFSHAIKIISYRFCAKHTLSVEIPSRMHFRTRRSHCRKNQGRRPVKKLAHPEGERSEAGRVGRLINRQEPQRGGTESKLIPYGSCQSQKNVEVLAGTGRRQTFLLEGPAAAAQNSKLP